MKVFDSISYVNSWDVVLTPIISPLNFFHSHCHWQIHVDSDTIYLKSAQIVMCFVTVHLHVLCRTQVCKLTRPAGQCTLKAMNINITNNYNGKVKMILILKYFVTWALYCSICILVYFFWDFGTTEFITICARVCTKLEKKAKFVLWMHLSNNSVVSCLTFNDRQNWQNAPWTRQPPHIRPTTAAWFLLRNCRADGPYNADVGSSRYLDAGFCGVSDDLGKDVVFLSQDSLSEDSLSPGQLSVDNVILFY